MSNKASQGLSIIFLATLAASTVDGITSEGEYGGSALDSVGFHQTAKVYRTIGKLGYQFGQLIRVSTNHFGEKLEPFVDHYGKPRQQP